MSFVTTRSDFKSIWQRTTFIQDALIVLGASLLIGLFAKVAIPLPFTPVPLATQAQVCLFLGALLGSKRGALAVLLFLIQGTLGLPVFATAVTNITWAFGVKGGYLLGYLFGTYLTGYLVERSKERSSKEVLLYLGAGNLVIFILGYLQLSAFVGFWQALLLGVLPFLVGDALKLLVTLRALKALRVCH